MTIKLFTYEEVLDRLTREGLGGAAVPTARSVVDNHPLPVRWHNAWCRNQGCTSGWSQDCDFEPSKEGSANGE